MSIRSMTGFAQAKGQINNLAFNVSIKSVNHRFLDLHFRLPSNTDSLEMSMRRVLKEKLARGHVDVNLSFEQSGAVPLSLNRALVSGYIQAFRAAAIEAGIAAEPDLNAVLRLPGALDTNVAPSDEQLTPAVLPKLEQALDQLNRVRKGKGAPWTANCGSAWKAFARLAPKSQSFVTRCLKLTANACGAAFRSGWEARLTRSVSCRKRRFSPTAAIYRRNWSGSKTTSSTFSACSIP